MEEEKEPPSSSMSNFKKDFGENVDDPFSTTTKRTLR
jgi:hypothetical protein